MLMLTEIVLLILSSVMNMKIKDILKYIYQAGRIKINII